MQLGHGETLKEPKRSPEKRAVCSGRQRVVYLYLVIRLARARKKNNTRLVLDVGTPSLLFTMVRAHSLSLIYESTIILIAVF